MINSLFTFLKSAKVFEYGRRKNFESLEVHVQAHRTYKWTLGGRVKNDQKNQT